MIKYLFIFFLLWTNSVQSQDTIKPEIKISDPKSGETKSGKIVFVMTATDNVAVTHVDLYCVDKLVYQDYSTGSNLYVIEWDSKTVPNSKYIMTAKAYDAAGNMYSSSVLVKVENIEEKRIETTKVWLIGTLKPVTVKYIIRRKIFNVNTLIESFEYYNDKGVKIDLAAYYSTELLSWVNVGSFVL